MPTKIKKSKRMRIPIVLLFIILHLNSFSQKKMFFDENNKEITKSEFQNKTNTHLYTFKITSTDSSENFMILPKNSVGKLSKEVLFQVINELSLLSTKSIDTTKTIIINFFFNPGENIKSACFKNYVNDYSYKKFLKNNSNINQYFITQRGYKTKSKKVVEDKNRVIRLLLFKNYMSCGNYIIIKPDGKYLLTIGEYRQDFIPEIIKSEW